MVSITLDFDNMADASAALARLQDAPGMTAGTQTLVKVVAAPSKAKKAPAAAEAPAEAKPEAPNAEAVPYTHVANRITEIGKTDRQKVIDLLTKFGVKRGSDLKPEQYSDFIRGLE